jgi:hypothetical protein
MWNLLSQEDTEMIRTISIALISIGLMAGCSKKEEKKAGEPAKTDPNAKPTDPGSATPTTPDPAKTDTAAPAGGGGAMDMAKAESMMNEMAGIFEKAGKDCDKLATDLKGFIDKNKDTMKASKDWEKSLSAEDKKKFEEKGKAMAEKMMPSMAACATNEKVANVMKEMAE